MNRNLSHLVKNPALTGEKYWHRSVCESKHFQNSRIRMFSRRPEGKNNFQSLFIVEFHCFDCGLHDRQPRHRTFFFDKMATGVVSQTSRDSRKSLITAVTVSAGKEFVLKELYFNISRLIRMVLGENLSYLHHFSSIF